MGIRHRKLSGTCLCGAVAFHIDGPMRDVIDCHCISCRKTTGHYLAATQAWWEDVTLEKQETLTWYQSGPESRRAFCNTCGSTLFFEFEGSGKVSISAGVLDGETGLGTAFGIYADSKGDYYDLPPCRNYPEEDGGVLPLTKSGS